MSYGGGYITTASTDYYFAVPIVWTTCVADSWRDWAEFLKPKGPQDGWYREFDPWPAPVTERPTLIVWRPYRAQARACIKHVRRWKRRRFLHALRRLA